MAAGEEPRALALVDGVAVVDSAAALFVERSLGVKLLDALDRLGNANGRYDIGDLLSWIERCREARTTCGTPPNTTTPASDAALPGAIGAAAMRSKRAGSDNGGRSGESRAWACYSPQPCGRTTARAWWTRPRLPTCRSREL